VARGTSCFPFIAKSHCQNKHHIIVSTHDGLLRSNTASHERPSEQRKVICVSSDGSIYDFVYEGRRKGGGKQGPPRLNKHEFISRSLLNYPIPVPCFIPCLQRPPSLGRRGPQDQWRLYEGPERAMPPEVRRAHRLVFIFNFAKMQGRS